MPYGFTSGDFIKTCDLRLAMPNSSSSQKNSSTKAQCKIGVPSKI